MRRTLATLAAALAAPLSGLAAAPECRGTISGEVRGDFRCAAAITTTDDGTRVFEIRALDAIEGVPAYAPGAFEVPGPVSARTYTLDELGMGRASVAAEGGTLFTAQKTSSQRGEVTLVLASVRPEGRVPGAYAVHGTYRARLLPAGAGKKGEVVVEVRF